MGIAKTTLLSAVMYAGISLLAACSSAPPKPTAFKATIVASRETNPATDGSAQPVHVRVFQLKDDTVFAAADFWSLTDKPQATLGAGLIQQLQYDLSPGEQQSIELKLDPDAHVLGVVAEFANYRNTDGHWRAVAQTPEKSMLDIVHKRKLITISIGKDRIGIDAGK
jgi:type VI secretion system protein VasD